MTNDVKNIDQGTIPISRKSNVQPGMDNLVHVGH